GIHACGKRGVSARASLYPHMTEQSLALNLAVLGRGVTPAIKHGGNHLAFIAISREAVLHLNTIKVHRDTLATRFDAFARILV
ncbi:hypothetical protein, partial [Klebsiella pneumoniae]|uniref:hypothetical protein n=1 Tax=Klebsiella pneumoniae TaxID=573 RepID=UPI001C97911F